LGKKATKIAKISHQNIERRSAIRNNQTLKTKGITAKNKFQAINK
jgi:hypothetical protein